MLIVRYSVFLLYYCMFNFAVSRIDAWTSSFFGSIEYSKNKLFAALEENKTEEVKKIIEKTRIEQTISSIINDSSEEGKKPLHIAVEKNNLAVVKLLLAEGADIDSIATQIIWEWDTKNTTTALEIATKNNFSAIVKYLLEQGASTFVERKPGFSYKGPLHYAAQEDNTEIVDLLLKFKADVNKKDSEGFTPLFYAAERGNIDIVEKLLNAEPSARVNIKNGPNGYNELYAVMKAKKNMRSITKLLVEKEADVAFRPLNELKIPLRTALESGNFEAAKIFIENGAFVNGTYLIDAVNKGSSEMASFLVKEGVNIRECLTKMDWTPLHLAMFIKQLRWLDDQKIDEEAIDYQDYYHGSTALHIAAENGFLEGVQYLIKKGANLNIQDTRGATPIVYSIVKKNVKILNELYTHGADVSTVRDGRFRTASALAKSIFKKPIPLIIEDELGFKPSLKNSASFKTFPFTLIALPSIIFLGFHNFLLY